MLRASHCPRPLLEVRLCIDCSPVFGRVYFTPLLAVGVGREADMSLTGFRPL
jgi:hypothetical protein